MPKKKENKASEMRLESSAFEEGGMIPVIYTCHGSNLNPPLRISGVPEGAKSLALVMEDPDASVGTWDHWIIFNMDPKTSIIEQGNPPEAITGLGTSGDAKYSGPCPPKGIHRYFFTLYALDIMVPLGDGATKEHLMNEMRGHVLAETKLMGRYGQE